MERVRVVGSSGSGKSTFARTLAERLGAGYLELDSVFHQPEWTPLPDEQFQAVVADFTAERTSWVIDGNYMSHLDSLDWEAADTVVWLDYSRAVCMRRVTWRGVARVISRRELWNGNRERVSNLLSWDPKKSIIRWTWTQHAHGRARYESRWTDSAWQHLRKHRLTSPGEDEQFLARFALD